MKDRFNFVEVHLWNDGNIEIECCEDGESRGFEISQEQAKELVSKLRELTESTGYTKILEQV